MVFAAAILPVFSATILAVCTKQSAFDSRWNGPDHFVDSGEALAGKQCRAASGSCPTTVTTRAAKGVGGHNTSTSRSRLS